jgi:hypothetical protein
MDFGAQRSLPYQMSGLSASAAVRLERTTNMQNALTYARQAARFQFLREQVATLLPESDAACVLALMSVGYSVGFFDKDREKAPK